MDSFKEFSTKKVPHRCEFYGSLKNECTNKEDYLHDANVWNILKRKPMGNYHDHFLKTDVLLLVDHFEEFISTYLEYSKLGPCRYYSSPGLSLDAMPKMADIKLELISDSDMCLFVEKGLKGRISYIAKRFSKEIHEIIWW